jgi:hypothetical protein
MAVGIGASRIWLGLRLLFPTGDEMHQQRATKIFPKLLVKLEADADCHKCCVLRSQLRICGDLEIDVIVMQYHAVAPQPDIVQFIASSPRIGDGADVSDEGPSVHPVVPCKKPCLPKSTTSREACPQDLRQVGSCQSRH